MAITAFRRMNAVTAEAASDITVAGAASPARTEGGLRKMETGSARPASPARTEGGLREMGAGSACSPVDLAEDGIDGAHDGHDVGDLAAGNDVRKNGEVREGRAPPLHPVRFRSAVAHQVAADLAPGPLDTRVGL